METGGVGGRAYAVQIYPLERKEKGSVGMSEARRVGRGRGGPPYITSIGDCPGRTESSELFTSLQSDLEAEKASNWDSWTCRSQVQNGHWHSWVQLCRTCWRAHRAWETVCVLVPMATELRTP